MQKVILAVVALVVGILLITTILVDTVNDAATDDYAENFNVSTGVGVTNTTEELSYSHYYGDLTDLSATSDNGNDTPVVMSYDGDTYDVVVDGLEASASRILTINYVIEAHQEFTGFSAILRMVPFILLIGLFVAALWALFSSVRNR
jgi:hypothetical protein